MRIAVLSGKGGTGKTFVSVNLSCTAEKAVYVDCDVEEPNGHLFLKPARIAGTPVTVMVPAVDMNKCTGCRKCVDFCKYNALALVTGKLLIFHEVCHSCGGCVLFCPTKAIAEKERRIGTIEEGRSGGVTVLTGCLDTGEVSGVPIIKGLMKKLPREGNIVIDCPPGSACIVMESIKDADYCVLVAEPTLFGVHNLGMVYELVKLFNKPFGVVLNKCLDEENPAEKFCFENNIMILCRIPFDNELGTLNSNAEIAVNKDKKYRDMFSSLLKTVLREVQHETTTNP